jgi:hypothetical protein
VNITKSKKWQMVSMLPCFHGTHIKSHEKPLLSVHKPLTKTQPQQESISLSLSKRRL